MPRTRHPLDYAFNRLLVVVGLAWSSWLPLLPAVPKARRAEVEAWLARQFGLPAAVEQRVLQRYRFAWTPRGRLRRICLIPPVRTRTLPGMTRLKELFRL